MGERVWAAVVASVVIVGAIVVLLPGGPEPKVGGDPAADLLAAFERSRTATFVVEQTFSRTGADGASISYARRLVQRPPDDRLLVGGGAAEGRLGGLVVRCSTAPSGASRCVEGPEARPYAEEVAAEVAALRSLVTGDRPAYEVVAGEPGCWSLVLQVAVPAPPYGELAGFCFDEATGAPTRLEIRRDEAVDVVEATAIRTEVTEEDRRPGDLGPLPG